MIVRGFMVEQQTGSPFLVSLVPSLHLLPGLVIGPAGGFLADRFDRRMIVLFGEIILIVAYLSLALLSMSNQVETWHVLATTLLMGVAYSLASPSRQSLIVDTVPKLIERRAVGSYMLIMHVTLLLAPAIVGYLLAGPGVSWALIVTGLIAIATLPIYFRIRVIGSAAEVIRSNIIESTKAGFREIATNSNLRWMFAILIIVLLFANTWGATFPRLAIGILDRGASGLAAIGLAVGIGAIVGAIASLWFEGRVSDARLQFGAALLFASLIIGVALSNSYLLTLLLTVAASAAGAPFFINNMIASQVASADERRASVISVRYIILSTQPIGMILLGAVAESVGVQFALAGSSFIGVVLILALAISVRKASRNISPEVIQP
jgi:MFS family permease